ncbi:MAG TPA: type II methionyl aminopeptidase, partial [Candidatus Thermoplasmatota archaeon]|nr:type II methionyl aminopeptidase [Candidatus Thermoplasmatota archaeon]
MDSTIYENYKRAGAIAADARTYGVSLLKPGARCLDVAASIEARIKNSGAGLAFPVNIAVNALAAHYSPRHDDTLEFKQGDVVKLDVGAHVDGYIADTAVTFEIGSHSFEAMVLASSSALEKAIEVLKAGVPLSDLGAAVQDTITSYGYRPIDNLMGHGLGRFELHSGLSVPNVKSLGLKMKPREGDVLAIEPFATNGLGHVISGGGSNIYLCNKSIKAKLIRDNRTKMLFERMAAQFGTLPFAERWYHETFPNSGDLALKKLSLLGVIKQYPQLFEAKGGIVTQKEHTVIVKENGCEVIT